MDFPEDLEAQLNADKLGNLLLQVAPENTFPPVVSTDVASLTEEDYAAYSIVDWRAHSHSARSIEVRLLFDDPSLISAVEGATDTLFATLYLEEYKDAAGSYVPRGSHLRRNLPPQMDAETGS